MSGLSVTVHRIGDEGEPVAVIENFAADPVALRSAATMERFEKRSGDHYPGLKAPVPPTYLPEQRNVLATVLDEVFGIAAKVSVLDICFAMVTSPPDDLSIQQRIPHVDALVPGRVALIHYLVPGGDDGTAFYRHRSTGFETVDQMRSARYFESLNADLRVHGHPPQAYLDGDTPIFDRIGHFDGCYNRALIYRGRLLHCGAIAPGRTLSAHPESGRLTITGFFAAS